MKKTLYKIECTPKGTVYKDQVLFEDLIPIKRTKPFFFGIFKREVIRNEKPSYIYWIEYRIDEGRYWYGEIKPVYSYIDGCYLMEMSQHHTKNDAKDSISIVENIRRRAEQDNYNVVELERLELTTKKMTGLFLD